MTKKSVSCKKNLRGVGFFMIKIRVKNKTITISGMAENAYSKNVVEASLPISKILNVGNNKKILRKMTHPVRIT